MILENIRNRAAADIQHILLPEGDDVRTLQAAEMCTRDRIAKITVLGVEENVRSLAAGAGVNLNGVEILDHRKSVDFGRVATLYYSLSVQKVRRSKNRSRSSRIRFISATCWCAKAKLTGR